MFAVFLANFVSIALGQFAIFDGTPNDDLLIGNNSIDLLFGGLGNDIIFGGGSIDFLFGGDGVDVLLGGRGNDILVGQQGIDFLFGEQGNDILVGSRGNDVLIGGPGCDAFIYDIEQNGTDIIVDFNFFKDAIVLFSWVSLPDIELFSCDINGNIYYENDELAQILTKPFAISVMSLFIDATAIELLLSNPAGLTGADLNQFINYQWGGGLCLNRPPPNDECPCFGQILDEPGDLCIKKLPGIIGIENTLNSLQSFEGTIDYYNRVCILDYFGNGVQVTIAKLQLNNAEIGRCVAQAGVYEQQTSCISTDVFNAHQISAKEMEFFQNFTELSIIDQACLLIAVLVFILVLGVGIKQVCFRDKPIGIIYDTFTTTDIGSSTDTNNDQSSFLKH